MPIKILKLTLGMVHTNCYIVGDIDSGDAIVIDPADRADLIVQHAQNEGWTIREILATHGHFDHILASAPLKEATSALFRIHERDLDLLRKMPVYLQSWLSMEAEPAAEPDHFVKEGEPIMVGAITLDVLFTPGHTPGHVSYVLRSEKTVFCGDVLFRESIGRTDLPGGDHDLLMESITTKLLPLGDDYTVMSGHMDNTTIGHERQSNPYIAM